MLDKMNYFGEFIFIAHHLIELLLFLQKMNICHNKFYSRNIIISARNGLPIIGGWENCRRFDDDSAVPAYSGSFIYGENEHCTNRTQVDFYSLGATLFWLFFGKKFPADFDSSHFPKVHCRDLRIELVYGLCHPQPAMRIDTIKKLQDHPYVKISNLPTNHKNNGVVIQRIISNSSKLDPFNEKLETMLQQRNLT